MTDLERENRRPRAELLRAREEVEQLKGRLGYMQQEIEGLRTDLLAQREKGWRVGIEAKEESEGGKRRRKAKEESEGRKLAALTAPARTR
jgi:hypothetical protein